MRFASAAARDKLSLFAECALCSYTSLGCEGRGFLVLDVVFSHLADVEISSEGLFEIFFSLGCFSETSLVAKSLLAVSSFLSVTDAMFTFGVCFNVLGSFLNVRFGLLPFSLTGCCRNSLCFTSGFINMLSLRYLRSSLTDSMTSFSNFEYLA